MQLIKTKGYEIKQIERNKYESNVYLHMHDLCVYNECNFFGVHVMSSTPNYHIV